MGRREGYFDKLLNGENRIFDPDGVPNYVLTQRIGRNEVLKSNVITNEERRDNGNGWDSRRCVDVFGRRRDCHVINLIQSVDSMRAGEYTNAGRTLQHNPLSTTEGRRVALMNVGSFTEIRGDPINSGHRWSKKRKLSTWIGTSKKKLPMRFDDGLCECRRYGRNREDLHHQA